MPLITISVKIHFKIHFQQLNHLKNPLIFTANPSHLESLEVKQAIIEVHWVKKYCKSQSFTCTFIHLIIHNLDISEEICILSSRQLFSIICMSKSHFGRWEQINNRQTGVIAFSWSWLSCLDYWYWEDAAREVCSITNDEQVASAKRMFDSIIVQWWR